MGIPTLKPVSVSCVIVSWAVHLTLVLRDYADHKKYNRSGVIEVVYLRL